MNNWSASEVAFRCDRLFVRMERLAQNFLRIGALSVDGSDSEAVLALVRESKVFLELIAIDLDVELAFELAQIQRQLSRWHIHWDQTWLLDCGHFEHRLFHIALGLTTSGESVSCGQMRIMRSMLK